MSLRRPGKRSRLGGVLHSLRKRWRAWRRLREGVCLWSHPQYELHGIGQSERARGMTAERARRIVGRLAGERLICRGDLRRPRPASYRDLVRFHSPTYLASTADPETLVWRTLGVWVYIAHLGTVLSMFATFPYSKFAHLLYRSLAMVHERMVRAESGSAAETTAARSKE